MPTCGHPDCRDPDHRADATPVIKRPIDTCGNDHSCNGGAEAPCWAKDRVDLKGWAAACQSDSIAAMEERDAAKAENAALRALIEQVEWRGLDDYCPWCLAKERMKHDAGCPAAAVMGWRTEP